MIDIVFVVLHYLTIDDTIECVNSIKEKCKKGNFRIVIVDNASPNNSKNELKEVYENDTDIHLVLLSENLGFANGNNKGIEFARKKYSPRFIVVMNNDVNLLQENTIELIEDEYKRSRFGVLGPMVYTADGRCNDNPGPDAPMTLKELDSMIHSAKKYYLMCKLNLRYVYALIEKIKYKIIEKKEDRYSYCDYLNTKYNVQLHGCFLCFSEVYFKEFNGFYPGTFLYLEEDILFYLTQKANIKTVYFPELKIYHKEDSSSKAAWKTNNEREKKKAKYVLQSAEAFREYLKENTK